jgi:hypothetical protein
MSQFGSLFAKYQELSDKFIDEINATPVVLHYPAAPTASGGPASGPLPNFDRLGGRNTDTEQVDRTFAGGTPSNDQGPTETIIARVYWINKINAAEGVIKDKKNQCKIIAYRTDEDKFKSAVFAEINGQKMTMVGDPGYHGMGGDKRYITMTWEDMN